MSSHTVPHVLLIQISTLPSELAPPPTSWSSRCVQSADSKVKKLLKTYHFNYFSLHSSAPVSEQIPPQATPASSVWLQFLPTTGILGHDSRDASHPVQATSSKWMAPDPCPKWASMYIFAPFVYRECALNWSHHKNCKTTVMFIHLLMSSRVGHKLPLPHLNPTHRHRQCPTCC